jgi:hypothetical protein
MRYETQLQGFANRTGWGASILNWVERMSDGRPSPFAPEIAFMCFRVRLRFAAPILEIPLADNVVPLTDGTRLVTADSHRDTLGHSGANEISHARPPEIVEN